MIVKTINTLWRHFVVDSLFRNSVYLMVSTGVMSVFGFFFWVICSHLYPPSDIGLATSLISAATLMAGLSFLGFNNAIIRFLDNSKNRDAHLSTVFILTGFASLVTAMAFLCWAVVTSNVLVQSSHLLTLGIVFTIYVLSITVNCMIESAFVAYRAAKYILLKNTALSILKVCLVIAFIQVGFLGIVSVTAGVTTFACFMGFWWLRTKFGFHFVLNIDKEMLTETRVFAVSNYVGVLFGMLPSTVLSLIVLSKLGAQEAAFFYMPMMIVGVLNVIPSSIAQSLFAEISHDEYNLRKYLIGAGQQLFMLLLPLVVVTCLLSSFVLGFFGPAYAAAGAWPLCILAFSSLVGALNYFGDTLLNIKKRGTLYIIMNAINSIIIVGAVYAVAPYGLTAIAESVLVGQIVTILIYIGINWNFLVSLRSV